MERLTHERCSGIKTGYWSPEKKEALANALAEYENTGLTPDQIQKLKERNTAKRVIPSCFDETLFCPVCGNRVFPWYIFCDKCGQRLWEE